ncbi:glycosyltransferase family 2 protein [Kordiimonas gwangyangensis]|uniref:glycosyltransferase family 2 protein n=1 Tax=Kordiimonas gwangyangensis TaxID=288022 RepID=UPI00037AF284|nr:glycosyltransferase family 2 protein [Kordiimonas gwangyangensis]
MTKRPRVSVIVCAYQTGEKIRATIEAILAQDYSDLELLVIDDASGDDTTDLVRSYTDERLKLIVNEVNLGVVGSRNKGLQLAQGDYIATCDHDDVWRQGKLTAQVEYMDTHSDCGVVGTGWLVHSPNRTTLNSNEDAGPALLKWRLLHRNCLLHSSLLMRRSVIEEHGISYHEGLRFADDWQLIWQFAKVSQLGSLTPVYVDYYLHGENWSLKRTAEMHQNGTENIRMILSEVLGRGISSQLASDYFDAAVRGKACPSAAALMVQGTLLDELHVAMNKAQSDAGHEVEAGAARLWWRMVRAFSAEHGWRSLAYYDEIPLGRANPVGAWEYGASVAKAWFRSKQG